MAYYDTSKASMFTETQGLNETYNSNSYRIAELERHFHSSGQVYGLTSNTMARKAVTPIIVTGGSGAWGTELELHNGSVIESGSATKYFDLHEMYVSAVGTANRITVLEFYYGTQSAGVACTFQNAGDTITKATHGFTGGEKLMFSAGGGAVSAELNIYTTYYVINPVGNTFQVSLTSGGAAVVLNGDGNMQYHTLTQTLFTEQVVSKAAVNSDTIPIVMQSRRVMCSNRIWCRGWAAAGTNAISFFLGLHTYEA